MENSTIVSLIEIFNILSTSIVAFFAIFGIIAILGKRLSINIFSDKIFLTAFCIASIFAFAAELTFFNFQHYLKFFADNEFYTTQISEQNPAIILTSDSSVFAEIIIKTEDSVIISGGLNFKNLDRRITSIFIKPNFKDAEYLRMYIQWTDEESTRGFEKLLYKGLPHENYTIVQPYGKVSKLTIVFAGIGLDEISQITINKQIPLYFSGLRLLVVSLLVFAFILFVNKKLRAKTSFYLFGYKFNPTNKKQNFIYALSVISLILFTWICVYTTPMQKNSTFEQYNVHLVDAIIAGKTYLNYGNPEKLLNAERPYDTQWLVANGYERNVDWMWDWSWYKGKHYSYYGVVPAVIFYVPYKLITGNYLSHHAAVAFFISITIVLLALFWRFCVIKYMPDSRFTFYLLSLFTLFFCMGLSFTLRYPAIYTIVQAAGIMFSMTGIFLLFKSVENEKINYMKLFLACLCLALTVGCRPDLIFVSLLVPFVLWKYRSWKLILFIMLPYVMIAIPLCMYNYARFGSIFQFGNSYVLTVITVNQSDLKNPIAGAIAFYQTFIAYLFLPIKYSLYFPFVEHLPHNSSNTFISLGSVMYKHTAAGLVNFPIVFCLFYYFKKFFSENKFKMFNISSAFLTVAVTIIIFLSIINGIHGRYMLDFLVFVILVSLFCAYSWCNDNDSALLPKIRMKIVYVLSAISILVGLLLFVTGDYFSTKNPTLYRYLEYSLGILRDV